MGREVRRPLDSRPTVRSEGGLLPPDPSEVERQEASLREGLGGGPWRVARYDIRRAVY